MTQEPLPGFEDDRPKPDLDDRRRIEFAVAWLKGSTDYRHAAGCQCRKCVEAREQVRAALTKFRPCDCGWCALCWANFELAAGRL